MKRIVIFILICISAFYLAPMKAQAKESYISDEIKALCAEYGEIYDINENLLIAFCEVESSGRPDAVSANGQYIGLMQLNKDTFSGDLTDPANNISQGAEYLNRLRELNEGNMLTAISIYSGEGGRIGFYSMKVINRFFELYCLSIGKEDKCI